MLLKSSQKVDTNRLELVVEVTGEEFEAAVKKVFKKSAKNIQLPGFRKGKAPRSIIEKMYGKEVFYEDAINDMYPEMMEWAINEAKAEIVDNNIDFSIVDNKIDENGFTFKAVITTKPEVELGEYKGLTAEKVKQEVTDEEVNSEIEMLRNRNSRLVTVEDRPAQDGDITIIDFDGSVDGVPFEGGKAEGHSLTLGSNQFIPGFEEQIVGHNTGEEFDINVKFPEDYAAAELAGKDAVFAIKLHEIKVRELPELDDEFAKDVSETADTLEDLKKETAEKLLEVKNKRADEETENKLIDAVIENMKAEIPDSMIEAKIDDSVREFEYRLQSQGMLLNDYLKYTGTEMSTFRKTFRESAERAVKVRLALEKIAQLENIEISDDDVNAEYEKYSKTYGMGVDDIKKYVPAEEIKKDLANIKALDIVKESAKIKEVKAATEKKSTAKKPAAKKTASTKKTAEKDDAEKKPAKAAAKKTTATKKTATTKKTTAKKTATKKAADKETATEE